VTILEEDTSDTYGLAFKVQGWSQILEALEHLHVREILSGYVFRLVEIEFLDTKRTIQALTCIALKDNDLYLAPTTLVSDSDLDQHLRKVAWEIAVAAGKAGPNHEYLSKLADCMRQFFPDAHDEHLFGLEKYMLDFINNNNNELTSVQQAS